jgi:hypothetical protein
MNRIKFFTGHYNNKFMIISESCKERVGIYRNYYLFAFRIAKFPIDKLDNALIYMNHLNTKNN